MSENKHDSRSKRKEKQRVNKKKIVFLSGLGLLFCIVLFSLITFGGKDKQVTEEPEKSQAELAAERQEGNYKISDKDEEGQSSDNNEEDEKDNDEDEDKDKKKEKDDEEADVKEVEADDPNVIKAYEGDWKPTGTSQKGEHETNYNDGSQDRQEIRSAVSNVTGIDEKDMTEHWVGNNGDQKVEATVSDKKQNTFYRVYLSWVDNKGWKVTRKEELKDY